MTLALKIQSEHGSIMEVAEDYVLNKKLFTLSQLAVQLLSLYPIHQLFYYSLKLLHLAST